MGDTLVIDGDHETLDLILTYFTEQGWENKAAEKSWGYGRYGFIQIISVRKKTYGTWCFKTEYLREYKRLTKEEFLNKYCPELLDGPNWTPPTIEEIFKF